MVPKRSSGFPQGDDFGVGRRVRIADLAVGSAPENSSVPHYDGSNWDLASIRGLDR